MSKYIEREVAIKAIMNDAPEQVSYSREDAVDCIRFIPDAEVGLVRHGRWLLDGRCSECWANPLTTHKVYCPACGAKMDGGEEE